MFSIDLKLSLLSFTLSALITGVESQANCTSSSPDCCWVVRSWQLMGKTTPNGISSTDDRCCTLPMNGISCDSQNRIKKIFWSSKNLTGPIPPSIGNLIGLTVLSLHSNELSGPIPLSIWNLKNLTRLVLRNNQLNDTIPSSFGNLINLRTAFLQDNAFSGQITSAIGNLKELTQLSLASNQLSGPIPTTIGNLANLTILNLSFNNLSGPIPSEIGRLPKLIQLLLRQNNLSGYIPQTFENLSNLTVLNLGRNQLSGRIPAEIGNLKLLTSLRLFGNLNLTGALFPKNCGMKVTIGNTNVTLCGCANEESPVGYFPAADTPIECIASEISSDITTVTKRAPVLSYTKSGFLFTCNTNTTTLRPYQDCINLIGAYCLTTTPVFSSWSDCHSKVLSVRDNLNSNWKSYINYCAQFITGGNPTSQRCNDATNQILTNEYYVMSDGTNVNVPLSVVRGAAYIWNT